MSPNNEHTSPYLMLQQARDWEKLFLLKEPSIGLTNKAYILFLSVEMYLKAYLVLLDFKYASVIELEKLGHNMNSLFTALKDKLPPKDIEVIKSALNHYNLFNINWNELRYPSVGRQITLPFEITHEQHPFAEIFKKIQLEINSKQSDWVKLFRAQ